MKQSQIWGLILVAISIGTFLVGNPAFACSPAVLPVDQMISGSDVVFMGTATQVDTRVYTDKYETRENITTFDVSKVLKGEVYKTAKVRDAFITGYSCVAWSGKVGESYLVFAKYSSTTDMFNFYTLSYGTPYDEIYKKLGPGKNAIQRPVVTKTPVKTITPAAKANPAPQAVASSTPVEEQVNPAGKIRPSFFNRVFLWFKNLF